MPETLNAKPGNHKYEGLERKSEPNPKVCVEGTGEVEGGRVSLLMHPQVSVWLAAANPFLF